MTDQYWRLPDSVDELLPPFARDLELLRRQVLDTFHSWGFDYVEPPVIEFLDALLVGSSSDMELQTFTFVDQPSGRLLGLRADMTSQAVRIDAHSHTRSGTQRLCYAGSVVYANAPGTLQSRVPLMAGAEIFGEAGLNADAEVVNLMVDVLAAAGIGDPVLVLGHVGIYQALASELDLDTATERALFQALQNKAEPDIVHLLGERGSQIARLPGMMGRSDVLATARALLDGAPVMAALDALEILARRIHATNPGVDIRFDLAEVAGFGYHNGPVFTAFHPDHGQALAKGGRYDNVGSQFGNARPATGFDMNLKPLVGMNGHREDAIWVPFTAQPPADLVDEVRRLREDGSRVVVSLRENEAAPDACNRVLAPSSGGWQVQPL